MAKPTSPQKKFLARIMELPETATFHEQFPYGAHCRMRTTMEQNGWIVYRDKGYRITDAGRTAAGK